MLSPTPEPVSVGQPLLQSFARPIREKRALVWEICGKSWREKFAGNFGGKSWLEGIVSVGEYSQ